MKFIALFMTFNVLNAHKEYNGYNFRNHFDWKYFKVSQIDSIDKTITFNLSSGNWANVCEVTIDSHVALVDQTCDELIAEINTLGK
jgi:hypothetical protein